MTQRKSAEDLQRPVARWTDAERETLRGLWARVPEMTGREIGAELGRGRGQVMGMVRALKLTPRDAPVPRKPGKKTMSGSDRETPWTAAEADWLCTMWNAGSLSVMEIGAKLKRSGRSVSGKVRRLKLPPRPSPIKAGLKKVARVGGPPEVARFVPAFPAITAEHIAARSRASVRHGCDMPLWSDAERPTHRYCGAPTKPGQSYCTACHSRVFTAHAPASIGFRMNGWGKAV